MSATNDGPTPGSPRKSNRSQHRRWMTSSTRQTGQDAWKSAADSSMYESVLSEAIAEERQRKRNTFDSEVWERNSSDDLSSGEWTSDSRAAPSPMDAEAVALLGRAAAAAAERGHAKTTPGDLLLALFEEDPGGTSQAARESPALRFLRQRGIDAGEMRRASDWSDNASDILRLASQRAASREKRLVGTEDLLWAMFQPTQSRSRSLAVERLEKRGVNLDLVWGNAELSDNARLALAAAIDEAARLGHQRVGSEDLLWALFQKTKHDSRASNWLNSQHLVRGFDPRRGVFIDPTKERESIARLFVVGGLAGMIETSVQQPLVYWKTMAHIRQPITWTPQAMFRGVGVNAGSIGPISAVQLAANGILERIYTSSALAPIGDTAQLGIAAMAGAMSCALVTPVELLMISQQRTGQSLAHVTRDVFRAGGSLFYRGNVPCMVREAAWTCGFIGMAPLFKTWLQADSKFFRRSEVAAAAVASIVAGQIAATISQPADVIKTILQSDRGIARQKRFDGVGPAIKWLYKTGGTAGFFRGLPARSLRCCGAVFILGEVQTQLNATFDAQGLLARDEEPA